MYNIPSLIFSDKNGNLYDHPTLKTVVRSASFEIVPYELEMLPLPKNTQIKYISDALAYAYDQEKASILEYASGLPVYVELPPGYLRTFMPSFKKIEEKTILSSGYAPVGWMNDSFQTSAMIIDHTTDYEKEKEKSRQIIEKFKSGNYKNPFIQYFKNETLKGKIFFNSYKSELNIPVKALDLDDSENVQVRADKIKEYVKMIADVENLKIISIGRDGDREPLNYSMELSSVVRFIKDNFKDITVTLQSSLSKPDKTKEFLDAGIDCISTNIHSASPDTYKVVYSNETTKLFDSMVKSLELANKHNVYSSLNFLTLPGFSDREKEIDQLLDFISAFSINYIKWKSIKIDPQYFFSNIEISADNILGIQNMLKIIKKKYKKIKYGFYNLNREEFHLEDKINFSKRRKS